jgi:DHA2 family multidrug resistance protein
MIAKADLTTRVVATGGLMLAILMQALDSTIANVALPHMMGSLSASQDQIIWILTSYIVATAIMTPFSGWLALKIGRKPLFLGSIAIFVAASVLCGMATNLPEMVLFRLLQGFAGAGMMPLSQAAVYDLWTPKAIPRVMSIWSAMIMVGPIMGPTLGGFLTENFSWRWVFYINVPVGTLAFAMIYSSLPGNDGGRQRPFDFMGFIALVLFTGGIQLMVDRGPSLDWFGAREIWGEAVIALMGLYVFIAQMATAKHPFFPREVLHDRNFMAATTMLFFTSVLLFSTNALMPSFMQNLLGYSALQSGEASMYRGLGSISAFLIAPWLARMLRPRPTVCLGVLTASLALWSMSHFDLSMTAANIKITGALLGFGMALMSNPLSVLSYATIGAGLRTEAAVFNNVVRTMGSSLGIATLQAVLTERSATAHARLTEGIIQSDPVVRWRLPDLFNGASGGLEALNAEITRQGSMMAYDTVFSWMAFASLFLLPLLLILRPARRAETVMEVEPLEA